MSIQEFDFSLDIMKVVPWQYDSAPNLISLLDKKSEWYKTNHQEFWENWERDIFNLRTANDFGLNVWSIILNLPLYTNNNSSPPNYPAFGFAQFGMNFGHGNFATDSDIFKNLTLEQRRLLLMLRYRSLISDGSLYDINETLYALFDGKVYCLDGLDMTITYIFTEPQPEIMMTLFKQYDILPRPSGVLAEFLVKPRDAFGFAEYSLNFDQPKSQFGS